MTRRPGWAWLSALIGVATLGVGGVLGWADPQQRPTAAGDALRHEIEDLAKVMLLRVDADRDAEQAEADRKAPKSAPTDRPKSPEAAASALADLKLAKLALEEYRDGLYPMELSAVETELKLAHEDLVRSKVRKDWDEKELASGRNSVSQATYSADSVALQKAEILAKQAESKRDVLVKFTHPKDLARLQAALLAAEKAARPIEAPAPPPDAKPDDPAPPAISVSLIELEREAIVALDEAMRLREAKNPAGAREKLREADRLWRSSEPSRIERRYAQLQDRIRRSADETRRLGR